MSCIDEYIMMAFMTTKNLLTSSNKKKRLNATDLSGIVSLIESLTVQPA